MLDYILDHFSETFAIVLLGGFMLSHFVLRKKKKKIAKKLFVKNVIVTDRSWNSYKVESDINFKTHIR